MWILALISSAKCSARQDFHRLEVRSLLNSKMRRNMEQCSDRQRKTSNSEQVINMGLETPFTYSNLCAVCLSNNFEQLYFWKKIILLHHLFSLIFKKIEGSFKMIVKDVFLLWLKGGGALKESALFQCCFSLMLLLNG